MNVCTLYIRYDLMGELTKLINSTGFATRHIFQCTVYYLMDQATYLSIYEHIYPKKYIDRYVMGGAAVDRSVMGAAEDVQKEEKSTKNKTQMLGYNIKY